MDRLAGLRPSVGRAKVSRLYKFRVDLDFRVGLLLTLTVGVESSLEAANRTPYQQIIPVIL